MTKNYSDQHIGLEIKYLTFPIFESNGRAPTFVDPTTLWLIVNKSVAILNQCSQQLPAKIFSRYISLLIPSLKLSIKLVMFAPILKKHFSQILKSGGSVTLLVFLYKCHDKSIKCNEQDILRFTLVVVPMFGEIWSQPVLGWLESRFASLPEQWKRRSSPLSSPILSCFWSFPDPFLVKAW